MKHPATSVSTHPMENRSALAAHSQAVAVFLTLSLEDFTLNLVCQQTISGQLSLQTSSWIYVFLLWNGLWDLISLLNYFTPVANNLTEEILKYACNKALDSKAELIHS